MINSPNATNPRENPMLAYHNDPAVKAALLDRTNGHIAADELVRGVGYEPASPGKKGKMCAVGCSLETYDHSEFPAKVGWPEWLGRVEDVLFEGMSVEKSRTWPLVFAAAIPVGVDLEAVKAPFLVYVLKSTLNTFDAARSPEVDRAVRRSIALWERTDVGSPGWRNEAEKAAWAWGEEEAAKAAAWAASAEEETATATATAATWAAQAAEAAEARYDQFSDHLIVLLAAAPVVAAFSHQKDAR